MSLIQFVRNYTDLSTETGYQFKFICDKCGSGWVSEFQPSATGMAGGVLRAAGNMFGGILGQAARSESDLRRTVAGPAHDAAMRKAVDEAKQHFHKCSRCGKWVCPDSCWNSSKGLCEECAPNLREEAASAQAIAARDQMMATARTTDYTREVDMTSNVTSHCPQCDADVPAGKFCPECGASISSTVRCHKCNAEMKAGAKFCPECGQKNG